MNGIGYNMHLVYCCSGEAAVIDVWGYFDDHKVIQLISLTMVEPLQKNAEVYTRNIELSTVSSLDSVDLE